MRKFKKRLVLTTVVLFIFVVSFCGTSLAKRTTIQFWFGLGGKLGETMCDLITQFNESQNEVEVVPVIQGSYGETTQKYMAAIAADIPPAVVLLTDKDIPKFAMAGALLPLDDYVENTLDFNQPDFVAAAWKGGIFDDKQYSLPIYWTTHIMYYRKDLLEAAGLSPDVMNTWESLADAARKITELKIALWGWEPMWGMDDLVDATYSYGGKILSEDKKEVLIDSPEWIYVWEQFRKWIHEEKIMRIHYLGAGWAYWYATMNDVVNGLAAGYTGSAADQSDMEEDMVAGRIGAHVQPGWEIVQHATSPFASSRQFAISANISEDKKEAAWKWLVWRTSSDPQAEFMLRAGYPAVRQSSLDSLALAEHLTTHPWARVPLDQGATGVPAFIDFTGGLIDDALGKAADKVEIQGISAEEALRAAAEEAQEALDEYWAEQG